MSENESSLSDTPVVSGETGRRFTRFATDVSQ